jgi:hypothetical protein
MNLSFSFIELGIGALSHDSSWFTAIVVRSNRMKRVVGGWSRLLKEFFKVLLLSESGLSTAGMPCDILGQPTLVFANLGLIISDGDGLKLALQWNGASGLKPCWHHFNVMKKDSERQNHDEDGYVEISCCDPNKFRAWSDHAFEQAIDVIVEARSQHAAGELTKSRLVTIEQGYGYKATAEGLPFDAELRRCFRLQRVVRYDWVHTFLADGIVTGESWLVIEACASRNVATQTDLHAFLSEEWVVPKSKRHQGRNLARVFNESGARHNSEHQHLKCSASEVLSLYGLLRHFVDSRLAGDRRVAAEVLSFKLACKVRYSSSSSSPCDSPYSY